MDSKLTGELTLLVIIRRIFLLLFLISTLWGCVAVKDAPPNVPYAYDNKVHIAAPGLHKEERTILEEKLVGLVADSFVVPTRRVLGGTQRIKPPRYDSLYIGPTKRFMSGFLNSEGYYGATFDTVTVDYDTTRRKNKFFSFKKTDRVEVTTEFYITVGRILRIDTVNYVFRDSLLMQLIEQNKQHATLSKNKHYSKQAVATELDRLTAVFRSAGYFKMSRAALIAEADTTDPSLVNFELDPIEQQISAQKRKDSPTVSIKIFARPGSNPEAFRRFTIDSVVIYPESNLALTNEKVKQDSSLRTLSNGSRVIIKEDKHLYQEKMLRRSVFLVPDSIYTDKSYFRTLNAFSQMGPWQQVEAKSTTSVTDSFAKVAFHLFLYPAKRQSFQLDLEGSQNNNISTANVLSGRFFAVALAATYRSRNVWKKGTQSTTSGRAGLELNNTKSSGNPGLFQSFIFNLNQTYSFPRLLWPFSGLNSKTFDNAKTLLNGGVTYQDRFNFFQQTSINANLAWEMRKGKNGYMFSFPIFETVDTLSTDSLNQVIKDNPSLAYSFTPGNVFSVKGGFERLLTYNNNTRHSGLFRISSEVTVPLFDSLFNRPFFKFVRFESQLLHQIKLPRASVNLRFYAGVGWDLSKQPGANMPFFRQFVAGGSGSMRAWSIRQLGIGNSLAADTAVFTDRFGDIQLEWNAEHRHKIMRLFGYYLNGAMFVDIGNIWNHSPAQDGLGKFDPKYLYRDLAMAGGYGFRYDLSFLVIRFDFAYKIKDPVREGNGWMKSFEWESTNRLGTHERSNFAMQFGIGYPF
ncbi:MAG TPA: BamA/TamA family outer membrane protein [Phnomibacter sp.]|nr:BamA/TamA family outer membrane protein [Phnomibacter sp.]